MSKKAKKLAREIARLKTLYGKESAPREIESKTPTPIVPDQSFLQSEETRKLSPASPVPGLAAVIKRDLIYLFSGIVLSLAFLFGLNYLVLETRVGEVILRLFGV